MRVWVLLIAACSTPAPKQEPVTPSAPPDDEDTSVAWQRAHPPVVDAGVYWDQGWESIRTDYEKLMATTPGTLPCDFRRRSPGTECQPPYVMWHAAKVVTAHPMNDSPERSELELDIGSDDKLRSDWWAAVVDITDRVRS